MALGHFTQCCSINLIFLTPLLKTKDRVDVYDRASYSEVAAPRYGRHLRAALRQGGRHPVRPPPVRHALRRQRDTGVMSCCVMLCHVVPCCAMSCADRGHDGQPDQRAQQLDPAVRLREHQLPLLQPHDEHQEHGIQLGRQHGAQV